MKEFLESEGKDKKSIDNVKTEEEFLDLRTISLAGFQDAVKTLTEAKPE